MAFSITDVTGILGAMPNASDIASNLAIGAASSVVLSGIQAQMHGGALDPLGLFKNTTPANNPNATTGPTITASAFAQLPPGVQAQLTASGVHIVAG